MFGVSSVLTPFALGAAVGAIASGRVPVGNARGELVGSLGDAVVDRDRDPLRRHRRLPRGGLPDRRREPRTARPSWPTRSGAGRSSPGVLGGAAAAAALIVMRSDAPRIYHGLTSGAGLAAVVVSVAAGAATLMLVLRRAYRAGAHGGRRRGRRGGGRMGGSRSVRSCCRG